MDELTFEEAWAIIELGGMIEYHARDNQRFGKYYKEYAATIPILKPGCVVSTSPAYYGAPIVDQSGIWACAKTWYYHETKTNYIPHITKEMAKKDIRRRFKATYKTSERFRKAVNQFLQGEQQ